MKVRRFALLAFAAAAVSACSDDSSGSVDTPTPTPTPTPSPTATPTPTPVGSLGAKGWATVSGGTDGGNGATAAKTYTVTNRSELIQALHGGTAVIAADGSYTGTLDDARKVIYVKGAISLNQDGALNERTADSYVAGSCANATYKFATEAALWSAYTAAYRPSVWGLSAAVSGDPESARACAATAQRNVVMINVPSNTSIIGMGKDAKLTHGNLVLGRSSSAPVNNVVVRNISFEDAFDFFPQWDPTDSTGRWNSAYDLISVQYAAHVWIDHNRFSDGDRTDDKFPSVWNETVNGVDYAGGDFKVQHHDGLVDLTRNANYATVSANIFENHDKGMLVGGTDTTSATAENPTVLRITYHDNWFRNIRQRAPRVRFGMVHVFNNFYEGALTGGTYPFSVAWTVGQSSKILAENNLFQIPDAAVSKLFSFSVSSARTAACVTAGYTTAECATTFRASGTLLNGTAVDVQSAVLAANSAVTAGTWNATDFYAYELVAGGDVAARVQRTAGPGTL
jgi:pectate lyase